MSNLYFSDKQLAMRFGVNRPTVWRWVKQAGLPRPIKLSAGCTRWRLADLERWESDKVRKSEVAENETEKIVGQVCKGLL